MAAALYCGLCEDPGLSATDLVTSDPGVTDEVNGPSQGATSVELQLDPNRDAAAERAADPSGRDGAFVEEGCPASASPDNGVSAFNQNIDLDALAAVEARGEDAITGDERAQGPSSPVSHTADIALTGGGSAPDDCTTLLNRVADLADDVMSNAETATQPADSQTDGGDDPPPGAPDPPTAKASGQVADENADETTIAPVACRADPDAPADNWTCDVVGNADGGLFQTATIDPAAAELTLDYAPNAHSTPDAAAGTTNPSGTHIEFEFTMSVNEVNDVPQVRDFIASHFRTVWRFSGPVLAHHLQGTLILFGGVLEWCKATVRTHGIFVLSLPLTQQGIVVAGTTETSELTSDIASTHNLH